MANIGLIAVDSTYPNLALMKVGSWYKKHGDSVEWYNPFNHYDAVYMSKIFGFTPDYGQWITNADEVRKGGTGYSLTEVLPDEIDREVPDYSLYNIDPKTAYGFLTRGCPNKCKWCVVPKKEGNVRPYMDIEEIAVDGRSNIILMDNNILASDYGLEQIEKIVKLKLKVDFNQALDARLVTDDIAKLLAKVKWIKRIRFGCDTHAQITECERAISLINRHGYNGEFFLYCILIGSFEECYERVSHWRTSNKKVVPYCQPYRDINNKKQVIPAWQTDLARWADRKEIFRKCDFKDYAPRKGFKCIEYFR